jgi:hypothetical protein
MFKQLTLPLFLAMGALAFLAAPDAGLQASECSDDGSLICSQTQECRGFLWWKKCNTTSVSYWHGI